MDFHTDIIVINLDRDTERLMLCKKELEKFGLTFKREPGIPDPARGNSQAMMNALKKLPEGGIIFEDDVELRDLSLPELPDDWDLLYFGANVVGPVERVNEDLVRLSAAWCAHAILYSKKGVKKVLSQYDYDQHGIYDDWLRKEFIRKNNCYLVTPMQAYQRKGYSNVLGRNVSYYHALEENYNIHVKKADK